MSASWRPIATKSLIQLRANTYTKIRQFMAEREILEVETPILSHATVTDMQLDSFRSDYSHPQSSLDKTLYLQTSPEYAMKRLLASNIGAIYQISKVFRNGEQGKWHNPEFTLLEWYQPDYDHHQLMQEVETFLTVFKINHCEKRNYADVFLEYTNLDPHTSEKSALKTLAEQCGLFSNIEERSGLLDFIFSHKITPTLGITNPLFVYDYPACQCALAKLSNSSPKVAERFELFIHGMEIANGFHELTDAKEQSLRFAQDLVSRKKAKRLEVPIDHLFLGALQYGLDDCSGVAVGVDRLLMAMTEIKNICEVLTFPIENA